MFDDELTNIVIGAAIEVHRNLGPGLLESVYKECLYYELVEFGLLVEKEKPLDIIYKKLLVRNGYRMDLFVDSKLVVEVKTVEKISDIHIAQTLTYLRMADCKLGLVLNFNVKTLKDGIKRVIL